MDHLEGLDLDRVVNQQGPLPVPQAVDYLIQAACLIEVAHASGIIHRDIRPGKLIVDSNGIVRVLGLGLSSVADVNDSLRKAGASRLTKSCADIATSNYMAPEQAEGSHQVDHRADIYSLGCALFYLLTGRAPFPGGTVQERLMEHVAPALRSVRHDVPLALEAVY
jgi:serine/threonine protein kinase